jgi:hypothetical protein
VPQPLIDEPRDLLVNDNNDLVISGGDLVFARGVTAVAQECRIAVQIFAEEWFLDLDAGIRYLQDILARTAQGIALVAKREYRDELLKVDGALEILRLDAVFDASTRTLTVTWQVRTALGNTPIDTLSVSK